MNEIMRKMKRNLVDPEMRKIKSSTIGYVTAVNYDKRTADVLMIERDGSRRRRKDLSFPQTDRGLYTQSLKPGDTVEIGYRNNNFKHTYIIRIFEEVEPDDTVIHGQNLPTYTELF